MLKTNSKRLLIALIVGIVVLNILGPVQGIFEYWFNAYAGLPQEVIVEKNIGVWMMLMILLAIIFEVILPMLIYVFIVEKYLLKSTLVIGLIFGLVTFFVGALPQIVFLPLLIRVPINFCGVRAFWALFNLIMIGGIIGGIYKPVNEGKAAPSPTSEDQSPI